MKKILENMLKVESKENILCGDIWLTVEALDYKNGLFTQVESKELEDGKYSNDIFSVFCYENKIDDNGKIITDYSNTVIQFDFNKKDL